MIEVEEWESSPKQKNIVFVCARWTYDFCVSHLLLIRFENLWVFRINYAFSHCATVFTSIRFQTRLYTLPKPKNTLEYIAGLDSNLIWQSMDTIAQYFKVYEHSCRWHKCERIQNDRKWIVSISPEYIVHSIDRGSMPEWKKETSTEKDREGEREINWQKT